MSVERIAAVLRETSGLEVDALGVHHLTEALKRMAVLADLDVTQYIDLVIADAGARGLLIGELLVHETSFFRYPASFEHLAAHARATAATRPGAVRILSAACATGQEPYSAAMALLDAGLPPERVSIDAFDRSAEAVDTARAGRYERGGTRGLDPERAARWFAPDAGAMTIEPAVRGLVRFACGNLLGPDRPFPEESYDAVLCRNLLIYLTDSARRRALYLLRAWLAPGGLLYVGHAEVLVARAEGFTPLGDASTYVCAPGPIESVRSRAQDSASRVATRPTPPAPPRSAARPIATPAPPGIARPPSPAPPSPPAAPIVAEIDPLQVARDLADAGRLEEACARLEEQAARGRPSADLFHLLALVRRAAGKPREADEALARALYLDPAHAGALLLAAVAAEGRGERAAAARFHARARAAAERGG